MLRTSLLLPCAAAAAALAPDAAAQSRYLFSIDWQSPTVGMPDPSGVAITEGDILRPTTAAALPSLAVPALPTITLAHTGALGLAPGCAGHPGGTPCIVEVDALSHGIDRRFQGAVQITRGQIAFSVDEFAPSMGLGPLPSVDTEAPASDSSADGYLNAGPIAPAPVPPGIGGHVAFADGDAAPSASGALYPGVGLIEPNLAAPGPFDSGDNLDALDVFEPIAGAAVTTYYSLDSGFPDPFEGVLNSGSAAAHGFVGGDVLMLGAAGLPMVYAPAFALGLDLAGADTDDLDALILCENGAPGFQPSGSLYDWTSGATDMLVFSVRRGSAVIGAPDSLSGIPIEEGDLLIPPVAGGVSPFPAILVPAEALGLATVRAGIAPVGADLNAADSLAGPVLDCDGDGIEDALAILGGLVADANGDGVPDACGGGGAPPPGAVGIASCFCDATVAPCGNASPTTGCINSVGTGALLSGFGPQIGGASITAPDLLALTTSGMPGPTFALMFYGAATIPPVTFGNGLLCVGGPLYRLPPILAVPAGGTITYTGVVAGSTINGAAGSIVPGSTWSFQTWYREFGGGPCGAGSNTSNALTVTFL